MRNNCNRGRNCNRDCRNFNNNNICNNNFNNFGFGGYVFNNCSWGNNLAFTIPFLLITLSYNCNASSINKWIL